MGNGPMDTGGSNYLMPSLDFGLRQKMKIERSRPAVGIASLEKTGSHFQRQRS